MMRMIYQDDFEGETIFGMFHHKYATSSAACQAVRNRKAFLTDQIRQVGKGSILSFAAGPVEEIKDFLNHNCGGGGGTAHYDFLALDHDISTLRIVNRSIRHLQFTYALANAFKIIKGDYRIAIPHGFLEAYCNPATDFKGMRKLLCTLKYKFNSLQAEEYDLVYTAGLYDYIQTFPGEGHKGTAALTANLFKLVKPGGALIIGNFSPDNPRHMVFPMEYIMDWQLIYRSREDMIEFAKTIPERQIKSIEVLQEPLGINYFLRIEKK